MSHSSNSSLLQLNRPGELPPQPTSAMSQEVEHRQYLETHESRHLPVVFRSRANSDATSDYYSCQEQPVASSSSGPRYLNVDPSTYFSYDQAVATKPSPIEGDCTTQLTALRAGSMGKAVSRDQWQPDGSSALCSVPFCTAIFSSSSYFSLGPRRHHCRKCGLLFCASHSTTRALMYDEQDVLAKMRVCDLCIGKEEPVVQVTRRRSNASDITSDASETLLTPGESTLSRMSSRSGLVSPLPLEAVETRLAPIEGWMDKDGVLSLYPLAHPTTSRQHVVPAAGPLFAPSKKTIRDARERELSLTLRQRRGKEDFAPLKFGGRSFDSVSEEDEDEEENTREPLQRSGLLRVKSGSSRFSGRATKRIRV